MKSDRLQTISEPAREIPVRRSVDVLVAGGGPAGLMAAQAAAGSGLKVMLVEARNFLGGNLVIGIPILAFLDINGKQIVRGLPQQFIDRLRKRNAASDHFRCKLHISYTIVHPEECKTVAMEIMEEAGVETLMNVFAAGVVMDGNKIRGIITESKAGREAILAGTVIDCTGDGDIAF
ncbi:MAG: FAD-dependent oxidoreductase, partial [Tannerella sp.]|nr:FAD-dependent oxidoreductase [Tannerella sp.]